MIIKNLYLNFQIIFIILLTTFIINERPPIQNRKYISRFIDSYIEKIKPKFKNQNLTTIYENCFPNTLDTTVEYNEQDTFIITGDIEAMWLRDSSFQMYPYLKFAKSDINLQKLILNLIKRQSKSILIDPYANAFNKNDLVSPWINDTSYKLENGKRIKAMNTKLWERKYELDSTISVLFFSFNFYIETGNTKFIEDNNYIEALERILELVEKEMRGTESEDLDGGPEYFFQRSANEAFDTLHQGRGNPVGSCGLVKTMFRNSDDAVVFAYNIPENAFLVSTFDKVSGMIKNYLNKKNSEINNDKKGKNGINSAKKNEKNIKKGYINSGTDSTLSPSDETLKLKLTFLSDRLKHISKSVKNSIYKNGIFSDIKTDEQYFAYEVDCYGNHYFIDDPGYPSLVSLPFFDFIDINDPIYISTRNRILSRYNPYFFKGKFGEGLGSAHSERYYIWPLFTIMRALTSDNDEEILNCINLLIKSAESTGYMHESFYVEDVEKFTRPWFAWANSFFGLLINRIIENKPYLLLK